MNINLNTAATRLGASFNPALENAAAAQASTDATNTQGLTVTTANASLGGLDDVDPAVEAAITRTDDMGNFLSGLFNLPAPPMPKFES